MSCYGGDMKHTKDRKRKVRVNRSHVGTVFGQKVYLWRWSCPKCGRGGSHTNAERVRRLGFAHSRSHMMP